MFGLFQSEILAQTPVSNGEDSLAVENVRIESLNISEKPEIKTPAPEIRFARPELTFRERFANVDFQLPRASVRIPPPLNPPLPDYPTRYVRIGGGRFATTLAEVYWNNGRNQKTAWGFDARHRGMANGFVPYAEFLEHHANAHLDWFKNRFILGAQANFHQADYHHYGDPLLGNTLDAQLRTRRNWIRLNTGLSLKSNNPSGNTRYAAGIRFRVWDDNRENQENTLSFNPEISSKIRENMRIAVAYEFSMANNRTGSNSQSRIFNHLQPLLVWKVTRAEVKGGFGLNLYAAEETQNRFYPHLEGRYELLKERMEVGGIISGGMQFPLMYNWIVENPYLDTLARLNPSVDIYRAGIWFSGKWARLLTWKVSLHSRQTDGQPVFFSNPGREGYFTVLYDTGFVQNGVRLDLNLNPSREWEGGASIQYNDNRTGSVAHFYHQPAVKGEAFLSWLPDPRLRLTVRNYTVGRRQMGLTQSGSAFAVVSVPAFSDFGIGAEYRFYKRFSLFLEASNLLGQSYERWFFYPERPLDFRGGLTAVF